MLKNLFLKSLVFLLVLSGCSTAEVEEVKLSGKRIPLFEIQKIQRSNKLSLPSLLPAEENQSWQQPGHNPAHLIGHHKVNTPLNLKWSFDIGSEIDENTPYIPAPIASEEGIFILNAEGVITHLDRKDGHTKWQKSLRSGKDNFIPRGGLSYQEKKVFVTLGYNQVICISAENGEVLWTQDKFDVPVKSAPTLYNGRAFVITIDDKLYALDQNTGDILWQYANVSENAATLNAVRPSARFNNIIGAFNSGDIVALRAETGLVNWSENSLPFKKATSLSLNNTTAPPAYDKTGILVSNQQGLLTWLNPETGKQKWQKPYTLSQSAIVFDNYVFGLTEESEIIALNKNTGDLFWSTQLEIGKGEEKKTWAGPLLVNNSLVLLSNKNDLIIIDPLTGNVKKNALFETSSDIGSVYSSPIVVNGWIYYITEDGTLKAFN